MGTLTAICISEKRGTVKKTVDKAEIIAGHGIKNDAHAGAWHRQISMLSREDIDDFNRRGGNVTDGEFGENLIISGLDFSKLAPGRRVRIGSAVLEITQIGKECHNDCEIKKRVGMCIMPLKGVFARVLSGGRIAPGDRADILE